jgi:hypothetical protein
MRIKNKIYFTLKNNLFNSLMYFCTDFFFTNALFFNEISLNPKN